MIIVEGDKVFMEVFVFFVGILKEIKVVIGDKVKIGLLIMVFEVVGVVLVVVLV